MNDHSAASYDAIVVVSFGGPDKREDVIPFLENVLRGRNVPQERMREVAEHYYHLGGKSPINDQNRALVAALERELARKGPAIPVYLGNRNWHPLLADTLREMATDGVRRALAFVTSAYGSYSGCRQYLDDIARAQQEVGASAPSVDKLRLFYNHPGFIEATAERVKQARDQLPSGSRAAAHLVYTAHSIPTAMAADSPYVEQLHEACRLVSEGVGRRDWTLVYQSRSGLLPSLGSSPTSTTICVNCMPRKAHAKLLSCRSDLSPTTWRCSTTWTRKHGPCARNWGWLWSVRRPSEFIRDSST